MQPTSLNVVLIRSLDEEVRLENLPERIKGVCIAFTFILEILYIPHLFSTWQRDTRLSLRKLKKHFTLCLICCKIRQK